MYEISVNADPEHFLDWDKPLSEQPSKVREALQQLGQSEGNKHLSRTGESAVRSLATDLGGHDKASEALRSAGIPGIKYLDQGSRGDQFFVSAKGPDEFHVSGPGNISYGKFGSRADANAAAEAKNEEGRTRNYVLFRDDIISILRKYGLAGMLGGGAAASQSGNRGYAGPLIEMAK